MKLSVHGRIKNKPGPLAPPCKMRPNLKMMALSYSFIIFMHIQIEIGKVITVNKNENATKIHPQGPRPLLGLLAASSLCVSSSACVTRDSAALAWGLASGGREIARARAMGNVPLAPRHPSIVTPVCQTRFVMLSLLGKSRGFEFSPSLKQRRLARSPAVRPRSAPCGRGLGPRGRVRGRGAHP